VTSSRDRTLRVWEFESGACIAVRQCDEAIWSLAMARDGTIIVGQSTGAVAVFRLEGRALV
jgi:hypothetical protein